VIHAHSKVSKRQLKTTVGMNIGVDEEVEVVELFFINDR
jgi:hypothetical protein